MKKKLFALCAVCVLLLSFAGCGGSAGGGMLAASSASQDAMIAEDRDFNSSAEMGWDIPAEAPASPEPSPEGDYGGIDNGSNIPANAKMIYTADLELETKEFDDAAQAISDTVKEMGGYFESRSINQGGYYRSMNCTIRVPAANFSAFLEQAGEAAHVTSRHEYSDNVSEAYYDQEARLTTQRTKLERLQELLSRAENMEDIITLESAISETELQIEYLTGSLRQYDSLINYSTVNLYLREVYRLSTDEEVPVTFGQRFGTAFSVGFQRGVDGLEDFAISVARNWMTLLILAAVIVVIVLLLRRSRRKKMERMASSLPRVGVETRRTEKTEDQKDEEKKE